MDSKQVLPCGLGCRDTLRFEVGLPLYGHELEKDITPIEAGLGMFVKLDKEEFIGKDTDVQLTAVEAVHRIGDRRGVGYLQIGDRHGGAGGSLTEVE